MNYTYEKLLTTQLNVIKRFLEKNNVSSALLQLEKIVDLLKVYNCANCRFSKPSEVYDGCYECSVESFKQKISNEYKCYYWQIKKEILNQGIK